VAVVANITFNCVNGRIGSPTQTVAEVSDKYHNLFTPADYAFGIWGLIYAATLVYAVMAILPSQLQVRLHDRIAPWLLLTNALGSLWASLFVAEQMPLSLLVILAMLGSCAAMYGIASSHVVGEHLSHWWRVPFGLWLGWLLVATIANSAVLLVWAGFVDWPLAGPIAAALMLLLVGGAALAASTLFLDPVVPLVISWASAAIAVEQWQASTPVAVVGALVAIKTLFLGARLALFSGLPLPRPDREAIERALRTP